jgi:sugar lactone lactonase YvrE
VEVINTRVKVLDPEGNYITNIGSFGVETGQLYRPKGVAIDPADRVFVSDSYLGVIQVFDREGRFLFVLGDEKGDVKKFKTPTGIFIDKKQRLYVVEMLADRVQVIQLPDYKDTAATHQLPQQRGLP